MKRMLVMKRLLAALILLALPLAPALAREQTDAPDAAIIGFSADGRYFAWEEYGYDIVSDALVSAIHVIDRHGMAEAPGFPFGIVPETIDDQFPAKVGGFEVDLDSLISPDGEPDLAGLRRLVRQVADARLAELEIGSDWRRIAGVPLTQRSPSTDPLEFVLYPTLPGGIPDLQFVYRLETEAAPEPQDCHEATLPARQRPVTFRIRASQNWPEEKEIVSGSTDFLLPVPAASCAAGMWISDIIAPPVMDREAPAVVVMLLAQAWQSHADEARWHALFLPLPEPK